MQCLCVCLRLKFIHGIITLRALLHGRLSILWTEFGCLPSGDDCVISKIVLIVDAKDMDSVLGSPYHEIRITLDALLSVTPQ